MSDAVLSSLIASGLSLVGVIVTCWFSGRRTDSKMEVQQAVIEEKISALTREVQKHNSFAERIPQLETKVSLQDERQKVANHRLNDIEEVLRHE